MKISSVYRGTERLLLSRMLALRTELRESMYDAKCGAMFCYELNEDMQRNLDDVLSSILPASAPMCRCYANARTIDIEQRKSVPTRVVVRTTEHFQVSPATYGAVSCRTINR